MVPTVREAKGAVREANDSGLTSGEVRWGEWGRGSGGQMLVSGSGSLGQLAGAIRTQPHGQRLGASRGSAVGPAKMVVLLPVPAEL